MPESHLEPEPGADADAVVPEPDSRPGPLAGLRVVELAGIGPGPYAAMLLADMGADVIRVERPGGSGSNVPPEQDVLRRNRRSVVLDLRDERGRDAVLAMAARADVLIEGFRPGVAERLGLGPDACWERNPALVYGRMTGWGQTGPLSHTAGHDIGYIAVTGALGVVTDAEGRPVPPANLVGDFGGGSTFLVMGVLAACWEAARSGRGQVVDAAIVDGVTSLTGLLHGMMAGGLWADRPRSNLLDGGMPWYDTYRTSDGRWMAVGALEPQFYDEMVRLLGLDPAVADRSRRDRWPAIRHALVEAFANRTQAEWTEVFEGSDACVAPVLSLTEAAGHPHLTDRGTFVEVGGVVQPAPAPRFDRTPASRPEVPPRPGEHTRRVLAEMAVDDVEQLLADGVATQA